MKHRYTCTIFLIAAMAFIPGTVAAQITIKIPKLPKITKEKPAPTTTGTETAAPKPVSTSTDQSADNSAQRQSQPAPDEDWRVAYHIEEIAKLKKQIDEWDPANEYFPNSITNDDYSANALSKKIRAEWIANYKIKDPAGKLDVAYDALKASLYKRLPENKFNGTAYSNRNAAEEKLMLQAMANVPGIKVFKIGLKQPSWLIDKNDYGIPTARYKHGLIFGRNPASEDPFCRIWYVNVIQDYAGGGTYGATYARYISLARVACPAGQ